MASRLEKSHDLFVAAQGEWIGAFGKRVGIEVDRKIPIRINIDKVKLGLLKVEPEMSCESGIEIGSRLTG